MTSYPLGKIRCTSCGSFINRKYGAYRTLINMNYTRTQAFEALHVPRYCCRAHFENPDIITLSLTTKEVGDVEKFFLEELKDEEGAKEAAKNVIFEMLDIDPYNTEDPDSLINDIHTKNMVSLVLQGEFGKRKKKAPIMKVDNEEIERAKRENASVQIHGEDELVYDKETGEQVKRRPLPIVIRPSRPGTTTYKVPETVSGKKSATRAKSMFSVGYKGAKRSAVRKVKEEEEGKDIYEAKGTPFETEEGDVVIPTYKVEVKELKKGEKAPEGYEEAYVTRPKAVREIPKSEARLIQHRK